MIYILSMIFKQNYSYNNIFDENGQCNFISPVHFSLLMEGWSL